jgi:small conductance mechanosensitive channel
MSELKIGWDDVLARLSPDTLVGALIYLLIFILAASLLARGLRVAVHGAMTRAGHLDRTTISFLQQIATAAIWVVMLILYAHLIPMLRAMGTALLAGASVASVVIGLAAQSTLGNLIAGISILIYRPFRLGDLLQISGPTGPEIGTVELLSLGYTILATQDGRRVIVPNSLAISQIAVNLNAYAANNALTLAFWVPRAQLASARSLVITLAQQHGLHVLGCFVVKSESQSVQLSLAVQPPPLDASLRMQGLAEELARALHEAGIATPAGKDAPVLGSN